MKIRGQHVIDPEARIKNNSIVDDNTGCWNWTGTVRSKNKPYGRLTIGSRQNGTRRQIGAHQYSYMIFHGEINSPLYVCHSCDNPRCVNPEHLFLGTAKDNADDRDRKGRNIPVPVYVGSAAPWSKLTDEQVAEVRASSESSYKIAPRFNMSAGQIRKVRRGGCYPNVPAAPGDGG